MSLFLEERKRDIAEPVLKKGRKEGRKKERKEEGNGEPACSSRPERALTGGRPAIKWSPSGVYEGFDLPYIDFLVAAGPS
jgi:hypothetical protein